jgi:hypothetical protein
MVLSNTRRVLLTLFFRTRELSQGKRYEHTITKCWRAAVTDCGNTGDWTSGILRTISRVFCEEASCMTPRSNSWRHFHYQINMCSSAWSSLLRHPLSGGEQGLCCRQTWPAPDKARTWEKSKPEAFIFSKMTSSAWEEQNPPWLAWTAEWGKPQVSMWKCTCLLWQ